MKSMILATSVLPANQSFAGEFPASMLEVGGRSVIDRLLSDVDAMEEIDGHLIVTNDACYPYFKAWLLRTHYVKPVTLINDGRGCVHEGNNVMCEILYVIERESLSEDVLVLNGNVAVDGSMMEFVRQARSRGCSCIACYQETSLPALRDGGVVVFDLNMRVVAVHDRPQVPPARWGVAPFVCLSGADVVGLYKAVAGGVAFDSLNQLLAWLVATSRLDAWILSGAWFDVTDASLYEAADKLFKKHKQVEVRT